MNEKKGPSRKGGLGSRPSGRARMPGTPNCKLRGSLFAGVEIGKLLPQVRDFGRVVDNDVGIIGMMGGIVLVVSLGRIEGFQSDHLSHNRTREDLRLLQLGDVSIGDSFLLVAGIENGRAILAAGVGSLTV